MKRLFTGIYLPYGIRERLSNLCYGIPGINWVSEENFHITLKFIGEVEEEKLFDISDSLSEIKFTPFTITIRGVGSFQGKPNQILWAGVQESEELINLFNQIEKVLGQHEIPKEKRRYSPHITLGRAKGINQKKLDEYMFTNHDFSILESVPINNFQIFSSVLKPKGPVYTIEREYDMIG
ncbi:MAG: RNA 2',3'-cyclic phosphodiesterase [Leptospiraceae bacterium]|nr:RNA 2',3'-cyclic phosphodiesterase [Leptospiraceae bacterium]MCP5496115.1 RNA 2',3'-cyclic phosphodiesterase [Leptospiraceae bacterium]